MKIPAIQTRVHIRWMIRRDMPEVLAIENAGFDHPWDEQTFLTYLLQRNCMVVELGERVVGFMIYELHPSKLVILNFAVHPESRRQGVGRQMIDKLIKKLSSHRRTKITMIFRETDLPGQLFSRAMGFLAVEVVREHYQDTGEDGYLMEYRVTEERDGSP